jgi:hypothetical protein
MNKFKSVLIIAIIASTIITSCRKDNLSSAKISDQINEFPKEPLSTDEIASLLTMREEEKLAYDVYMTLNTKWSVNVFENIASSEKKHTDAVLTLINRYNLADPVGNNIIGVFMDTTLQKLYTQLINQGNKSKLDAFIVGATIEDLDIEDLNNWASKIDNEDIKYVYDNLNKGSRNHMRSFYSQITSAGGTYTAQYISEVELSKIISSPKETGSW